jgi:hypothetical protein
MYYKLICILYALLCGQNFILVKSGCYRYGLYLYLIMSFGLANALAHFMYLMNSVFMPELD